MSAIVRGDGHSHDRITCLGIHLASDGGGAEKEAQVIGYLLGFDHFTFFANGRVSWVEEIMGAEEMRRQGTGRRLMESFEAWAKERQSKLVALATRRAAPFYRRLGYEDSADYLRKLL